MRFSGQGRILDRVWQVFGGLEAETIPLIEEKLLTSEKVQVRRKYDLRKLIVLVLIAFNLLGTNII